jgi:hypothetical protein
MGMKVGRDATRRGPPEHYSIATVKNVMIICDGSAIQSVVIHFTGLSHMRFAKLQLRRVRKFIAITWDSNKGGGENYITRSFTTCELVLFAKYNWNDQVKEDEMGGARSMHR